MTVLSDRMLITAIFAYLTAMVCYAAGYAISRDAPVPVRAVTVAASARPKTQILVAALGNADTDLRAAPPGPAANRSTSVAVSWWTRRLESAGLAAGIIGAAVHAGSVAARGLAAHRVPWGNMYEFVLAVTLIASIAWCVIAVRRRAVRPAGLLVSLLLVVLLGLDGMVLYTRVAPLVPALNSYWLKIHVTLAITASGVFLIGFAITVAYLLRVGYDRRTASGIPAAFPYHLAERLPPAAGLERMAFRAHAFAFPLWTLAVICGVIWAEAAWGRYWGWDPKETWSFIAWVIYAGYLHARATPSVNRRVVAVIAVAGWTAMMVNLFVVNIVIAGLHSYAGVK